MKITLAILLIGFAVYLTGIRPQNACEDRVISERRERGETISRAELRRACGFRHAVP